MFAALESHPWAYPVLEVFHIFGIALLVGNLVLLELRVFGRGAALPVMPLARLSLGLAFAGFTLVAASGLLMFATRPGELLANDAFILKIFDQDRPIYLEGKVVSAKWQNPHAELMLEVPADLKLPADLAQRALPAQSAPVDGKALLAKASLPKRRDRRWEIELAPLTRLELWKVAEIKPGTAMSVLGFTFKDDKGEAVLRAEYIFVGGKAYGLRSSPA